MTATRMDPALDHGYETCRRMQLRHDPTYYWATRRLPAEIRPATHALYGYVRTADEIVDGPRRAATRGRAAPRSTRGRRELERGLAAGRSPQPIVGALVDAGRRHRLPLGELRTYMRSMRIDCAPVRIADVGGARGLHGRLGGLGRADHGAAARRARARITPTSGRLGLAFQLDELHPRRARGHRARPRLPAGRGPRALRRERRTTCAAARTSPELRALLALEVARARARCSPRREPAIAAAPGSVRPGDAARGRRLPARARPRRADRLRRPRPRDRRPRRGSCPGAVIGALRR